MQALAGDEAAVLAGKEDETGRDLAGLTRAAHGGRERLLCIFVHCRGDEWCPYYCHVSTAPMRLRDAICKAYGADTVYADAVTDLLIR